MTNPTKQTDPDMPDPRVEKVALAIQREAQENGADSPVDYGDAERLAKVALDNEAIQNAVPRRVLTQIRNLALSREGHVWDLLAALAEEGLLDNEATRSDEALRDHRDFWLHSWSELHDAAAALVTHIDELADGQCGPFAIKNSIANSPVMDALRAALKAESAPATPSNEALLREALEEARIVLTAQGFGSHTAVITQIDAALNPQGAPEGCSCKSYPHTCHEGNRVMTSSDELIAHLQNMLALIEANMMPLSKDEYREVVAAREALTRSNDTRFVSRDFTGVSVERGDGKGDCLLDGRSNDEPTEEVALAIANTHTPGQPILVASQEHWRNAARAAIKAMRSGGG